MDTFTVTPLEQFAVDYDEGALDKAKDRLRKFAAEQGYVENDATAFVFKTSTALTLDGERNFATLIVGAVNLQAC